MRLLWCPALAVLEAALLAIGPRPLVAQVVRGLLVEEGTGSALEGAMVNLLDQADRTVVGALTGTDGRFSVLAPSPGSYRLRADRIGHASTFSPEFLLVIGDTLDLQLAAQVQPVKLAEIVVEGSGRCEVRPEEGVATARVWEEARKALAAAAWTEERGIYRYRVLQYERDLDESGTRVEREERRVRQAYLRTPFRSLPAEELMEGGFMIRDAGGYLFYGPDADVLLSDQFLDTHCLRLRDGTGEAEGLIGLAFEPVSGRRVSEIEGTLWLDPQTAELQWLEYRYRNLGLGIRSDQIGGHVSFSDLPNGTWIVRDWWIRMPVLAQVMNYATRHREVVLEGMREEGGRVVQVMERGSRIVLQSTLGTLAGAVLDSWNGEPVPDALVAVEGTGLQMRTGPDGTFRFDGLDERIYTVSFTHASLDSLSFRPPGTEAQVLLGEVANVRLVMPTPVEIARTLCPDEERPPGTAVLAGTVRDSSGKPLGGTALRITWTEWRDVRPGAPSAPGRRLGARPGAARPLFLSGDHLGYEVIADQDGRYLLCAVPVDHPLEARLERNDVVAVEAIRIPADRVVHGWDVILTPGSTKVP